MRELWLKETFQISETYKNGFVLVNSPEKRNKEITKTEEEKIFSKTLEIRETGLYFEVISDMERNRQESNMKTSKFRLTEQFGFNKWLIESALYYYKNKFFHFNNLKKHIIELENMTDFIENFLPKYEFLYRYQNESIEAGS